MDNKVKYLRVITRNLIVISVTMIIFVIYPNKKLYYKQALDKLNSLKELNIDTVNKSINEYITESVMKDSHYQDFKSFVEKSVSESSQQIDIVTTVHHFSKPYMYEKSHISELLIDFEGSFRWSLWYCLPPENKFKEFVEQIYDRDLMEGNYNLKRIVMSLVLKSDNKDSRETHKLSNNIIEMRSPIGTAYDSFNLFCTVEYIRLEDSLTMYRKLIFEAEQHNIFMEPKNFNVFPLSLNIEDEIRNLTISDAIRYCEVQYESTKSSFEIFGINVDKQVIALFGPALIFMFLIHLLIHLLEFSDNISKQEIQRIDEPWFPLYNNQLAKIVTITILVLYPSGVSLTLMIIADPSGFSLMVSLILVFSILIASFTVYSKIREIRKLLSL